MLREVSKRIQRFWQQPRPALTALIFTVFLGVLIALMAAVATSQSIGVSGMSSDPNSYPICEGYCERASEVIFDAANYLALIGLSIIGGFSVLLRMKSKVTWRLRMTVCSIGIFSSALALFVHYRLAIDLATQLFWKQLRLNIITYRLALEAGFVFAAMLALIFVFLTTDWSGHGGTD